MKKIIALILTVVTLLGVMAMSVSAESPETLICNPGKTVDITFALPEEYQQIKSGAIAFDYNEEIFEIVSAEWNLKNTLIKNVDIANKNGVFAFSSAKTVSGEVFNLKIKTKDGAAHGTYTLTATFQLKNAANENTEITLSTNLSVEEYVEVDTSTTPADFKAAVLAVGNDSSEATFNNIKTALEVYSTLTEAEKTEAISDYQQLLSKLNDYNSGVADANMSVETVTRTAFSVVVNLFAYLSELAEAIAEYIFN